MGYAYAFTLIFMITYSLSSLLLILQYRYRYNTVMVHLCQDMSLDFVRIIISKNSAPDWLNTDNLMKKSRY